MVEATTVGANAAVIVGDAPLRIEDVVAVAHGAPVELSSAGRRRIQRSRAIIEERLAAEQPTYGLNTGLGHDKSRRISIDELSQFSLQMLRAHEGGLGAPLSAEIVRAAILVRVNGIAQGGAGASPDIPETLVAMLNARVTPVVRAVGSVGAGDLGQMASIGLVAIGEGVADYDGERIAGGDALRKAGIVPCVIGPKDGLTLMSANGIAIGHAALVAARTGHVADLADVVAALSFEATAANPSVVDPAVGVAKPIRGQTEAAEHIRTLLEGSYLQSHGFETVQEALSFRVVPQVHGTLREVLSFAVAAAETELNAAADNPLVSDDGRIVHNGNFEPLLMAVAFDALRLALAHVGQLSDRRMNHLWNAIFRTPTILASKEPLYGVKLRYPAAARFAELRQLAAPATLDIGTLDVGVEDYASAAPLSVSTAAKAIDTLEDILVTETLLARTLVKGGEQATGALGKGTRRLLGAVEGVLADLGPNAHSADVHAALRQRLSGGVS
jgi:histidine ammonia-lyase